MELIEDNLREELNGLTKNDTISDFIISNITDAEKFYYSKNFNSINKELLKKVKMPDSKEEFVITLNTIFNSDKHRNDIAAIFFFNIPTNLAPPVLAPVVPAGLVSIPVPPAPVPVPTGPVPVPAPVPVPGPAPVPAGPAPIPAPRAKTKSNTLSVPANFKKLIDELNVLEIIRNQPGVLNKITQKEDEIGDLAYIEIVDRDTLARCLLGKPREQIPPPVLQSAEQMLLYAESRAKAAFAAAQQKATTPTKSTNAAILLNPFKIEL